MDEKMRIELYLWRHGYKTERVNGLINVHDPVHESVSNNNLLVISGYNLKAIKTMQQAARFVNERD